MVLPLYLAMRLEEMEDAPALPRYPACFFPARKKPWDFTDGLPPETMIVLTDRMSREDPQSIAAAVKALGCGSVLLDFEEKPAEFTVNLAKALSQALPCPLAAPPGFAADSDCTVFLPPCPLHIPLAEFLYPWQNREIWLDVTMQQQTITVSQAGSVLHPATPADRQDGGWFDETLLCHCKMELSDEHVDFILFDTSDTLKIKLEQAAALGVTRAVGLYQELNGKL